MFGKKKKQKEPVYDVTQKKVKTWWGGTKLVPTTKSEQKKMKVEILKRNPRPRFLTATPRSKRIWNGLIVWRNSMPS